MPEITKSYEPREVEQRWHAAWQAADAFAGRAVPGRQPYSIVSMPVTLGGGMTMGHVLNNTLQDILIRRARLEGRAALWVPGTDHAGIATQTVVERELRKRKLHRRDLGREKFLAKVWEWRKEKGDIILEQLRRLGASCDWSRTAFTMDPGYSRRVLHVFVELFRRGHIYRGKRMVNWCPASLTALSDEEVIMKPVKGLLYRVRYELAGRPGQFIEVVTTRPETIPGDTAIAVHPDDPRYAGLIGQTVWRPLVRDQIPIIADAAVDREFGTGALKITPAHDKADFEVGQRHQLPIRDVLNPDGVLNDLAGPELAGLDRFAGRKKAAELLKAAGALVKEEPYENNVGYSERADVPIEPRLTMHWSLRYPRVEEAKAAVRDGHIKFYPERWAKVYLHWLENIQDWCISRQLWWGHRIPVWYCDDCGKQTCMREDPTQCDHCGSKNIHQDPDVLDTWFSSGLWPFSTLGWPEETPDYKYFYPTSMMETAYDILFFWVARMIMDGLEFTGQVPFSTVYLHGLVRNEDGQKMSKSKGTGIDPLPVMEEFGTDALRFTLLVGSTPVSYTHLSLKKVEGNRNFANKIWNAGRFVVSAINSLPPTSQPEDERLKEQGGWSLADSWIWARLYALVREVERLFQAYQYGEAGRQIYEFFWNDFADWYVEVAKLQMQKEDSKGRTAGTLVQVLDMCLRLLHPFTPFVTEELWGHLRQAVLQSPFAPLAADWPEALIVAVW